MKSKASTPSAYIKEVPAKRRAAIQNIHRLIRKHAPTLRPYMQSGMLGYGKYHYKYASGREGDWCVVGLASQKNYMSLYVCMVENNKYLAEMYKKDLGKVSVGKSCIRFKKLDDLNLKTVEKLIRHAARIAKKNGGSCST